MPPKRVGSIFLGVAVFAALIAMMAMLILDHHHAVVQDEQVLAVMVGTKPAPDGKPLARFLTETRGEWTFPLAECEGWRFGDRGVLTLRVTTRRLAPEMVQTISIEKEEKK